MSCARSTMLLHVLFLSLIAGGASLAFIAEDSGYARDNQLSSRIPVSG